MSEVFAVERFAFREEWVPNRLTAFATPCPRLSHRPARNYFAVSF
jgi:hypothetical protein